MPVQEERQRLEYMTAMYLEDKIKANSNGYRPTLVGIFIAIGYVKDVDAFDISSKNDTFDNFEGQKQEKRSTQQQNVHELSIEMTEGRNRNG